MTKRQTVVGCECQAKKYELDFVNKDVPMEVLQQENGGGVFRLS